jgi:hypothetical protein
MLRTAAKARIIVFIVWFSLVRPSGVRLVGYLVILLTDRE